MCEIDIGNSKYTTFTKLVQVRNFITFELKVIRHEERETHNLSMLTAFTSSALNPTNARRPWRTNSSGLAQLWISTLSFGGRNSTQCFFSNPQILSPRFQCVTSLTSPGPNSYLCYFYFDISEWHILCARAWTPALMLHLTNPCTKRKVLSLTKPKGKIYKTKYHRNYITPVLRMMSWLTQSTGLNPIELVWDELDRKVGAKQPIKAVHVLKFLQKGWKELLSVYLQSLVETMPKTVKQW